MRNGIGIKDHKKNGIGTDAVVLTGTKLLTSVISLVSAMLLSRFRTLEEYGTYSQILLVVNLSISIFMFGLPNSINYFLARCEDDKAKSHYLSVYYTLNTILCIVMGASLVLIEPLISVYFKNHLLGKFTYILMILPWTKVTTTSISHVLIVYGKIKKLTIFNCSSAILGLLSILIVNLFGGSFSDYMLFYVIGDIILAIWVYTIVWKIEKSVHMVFDKKIVKSIFTYSIPIGLSGIVGTLMLEADKLIIGNLLNTESIAIYSNAAKELPFTLISTSFTAVLVPQLVKLIKKDQKSKAIELWMKTIEICFVFLMFIVTALVVFAPQIVTLLYSEKYIDGTNVFRIYSLILLLRITSFGIVLNATGKTKYILYTSIISLVINVILDYSFYFSVGFIGPAMATLFTLIIHALSLLYFSSKVIGVKMKNIFPWGNLSRCFTVNALWGIIIYLLIQVIGIKTSFPEILVCIVLGLIIGIIYFYKQRGIIMHLWHEINRKTE